MKKRLRDTGTGQIEDEQPLKMMREFCGKWAGVCLLKLTDDDKEEWQKVTTGSNSPNKNMRATKSTK